MRRILLLATLAVGALAAAPGVALANVNLGPGFGYAPGEFSEALDGRYVTLDANNQLAQNGPKVAFFVLYRCTVGESIGILAHAWQGGGSPNGGGGAVASCGDGGDQHALVIAQRSRAPLFSASANLLVEGIGLTVDAHGQLNDIDFESETCLSPSPARYCVGPS